MLRNKFYKTLSVENEVLNSVRSLVEINASDPIFTGHFPSVPIVPGVCMMQMIKEKLEDQLNRPLQLTKAAGLKFLAVINPFVDPNLTIHVSYSTETDGTVIAEGSISTSDKTFFKLSKAVYR